MIVIIKDNSTSIFKKQIDIKAFFSAHETMYAIFLRW